jgi:hypothetical protein
MISVGTTAGVTPPLTILVRASRVGASIYEGGGAIGRALSREAERVFFIEPDQMRATGACLTMVATYEEIPVLGKAATRQPHRLEIED